MSRKPRRKSRSGIYHIMLRGINRQTIFEDDVDKRRFLETLLKYKPVCNYQIYSYCLMDNHVHLLMKETDESISVAIKRISSSYVYWYNQKYERTGHLFQERFKAEVVENPISFLTVLRYIHQNPMKAGLAKSVFESKWTSFYEYIHQANIVDIDFALQLFSTDRRKAIKLYAEHAQQTNDDQCLEDTVILRRSDREVMEYLYELGIPNKNTLQQLDKRERNKILIRLTALEGVSLRQIARITGVSKSVIHRVGRRDRFLVPK
ncbi:transposase [Oceanobacillus halophilus]|uniref:Transposase n=1 Tax=Oceanobacillus halophilus TaxID=930130 RepID=A0A494ZT45_9BACI|nr:transposase [Oceanobacillus halophilus]RKQ29270.1 transposase [Oceanobacillus halophilus]